MLFFGWRCSPPLRWIRIVCFYLTVKPIFNFPSLCTPEWEYIAWQCIVWNYSRIFLYNHCSLHVWLVPCTNETSLWVYGYGKLSVHDIKCKYLWGWITWMLLHSDLLVFCKMVTMKYFIVLFADSVHVRLWPLSGQLFHAFFFYKPLIEMIVVCKAYGIIIWNRCINQGLNSYQRLLTCTLSTNILPDKLMHALSKIRASSKRVIRTNQSVNRNEGKNLYAKGRIQ